jgi:hypothetical protein
VPPGVPVRGGPQFYCEHWFTSQFFGKIREFGALLARFGVLADAEDVFQLHHTEVDQALSDVMLAWAAGGPPLGAAHWQPIVAARKRMLAAMRNWSPPPALGPVPEALNDPAVRMLWGVTQERIRAWPGRSAWRWPSWIPLGPWCARSRTCLPETSRRSRGWRPQCASGSRPRRCLLRSQPRSRRPMKDWMRTGSGCRCRWRPGRTLSRAGLPVLPGGPAGPADAAALAGRIGYPVLVKAAGGGGGRGLRVVRDAADLDHAIAMASAEAQAAFGDPRVYLERYVSPPGTSRCSCSAVART